MKRENGRPDCWQWEDYFARINGIGYTESLFEQAFNLFGEGLPAPVCQFKFDLPVHQSMADFCWRGERLIVECDGGTQMVRNGKHGGKMVGGRHNTDKDRDKLNRAAIRGYRVIRFSTSMLENDPQACIETVRAALKDWWK